VLPTKSESDLFVTEEELKENIEFITRDSSNLTFKKIVKTKNSS
jgi:hypothetical protein